MMGPGRNHPAGGREGGAPRRAGTIGGRGGSALEAPWAWAGSVGAAAARAGRGRARSSRAREAGFRDGRGIWRPRAFSAGPGEGERLWGSRVAWPCSLTFAGLREPPLWAVPQGIAPAARLKRRVVSARSACKPCLLTVPHCLGLKSIPVSFSF